METAIPSETGSTATPAPAPSETSPVESAPESTAPSVDATPQPLKGPKTCGLCFLAGKHGDTSEGTTCVVCGNAHGTTVRRGDRDRKVVVRHSLSLAREGGRKENGDFVNPGAPWIAPGICDDDAWEIKRSERGLNPRNRTRFFDLADNVAEAQARNDLDRLTEVRGIGFRMGVLARRNRKDMPLMVALAEEFAAAQRLDALANSYRSVPVRQMVLGRVKAQHMLLDEAIDASMPEINAAFAQSERAAPYLRKPHQGGRGNERREASGGERSDGGRPDKDARCQRRERGQQARDARGNPRIVKDDGSPATFVTLEDLG